MLKLMFLLTLMLAKAGGGATTVTRAGSRARSTGTPAFTPRQRRQREGMTLAQKRAHTQRTRAALEKKAATDRANKRAARKAAKAAAAAPAPRRIRKTAAAAPAKRLTRVR